MNYKIAICDDSVTDRNYITDLVSRWAEESGPVIQTFTFSSAENFLFHYAEKKDYDILLLDIEMGQMDGMTMARQIRCDNENVQIVFITGYSEYIAEGYEVGALHYLMKPVQKEKLYTVLDRAIKALQHKDTEEKMIVLPSEEGLRRVAVKEIIYVESFAHNVRLTTKTECFLVRMSISNIEEMLGEAYVRCHRSYLVGIKYIARLSKKEVILDSGKTLPLSRGAATSVQKAFVNCFAGGDLYETI